MMLKSQIFNSNSTLSPLASHKPFISGDHGGSGAAFQISGRQQKFSGEPGKYLGIRHARRSIKAVVTPMQKTTNVRGVVTVQKTNEGLIPNIGDDISDLLGKSIVLELVAAQLDPKTGAEKATIKGYAHKKRSADTDEEEYECDFEIPEEFGEVGAVLVENNRRHEMYVRKIVFEGFISGPLNVTCDSWVHPKHDNPEKRLFFPNKSYLPSQTPSGLKEYREKELRILRGNGLGERKKIDRIYDYDVYNDLGMPDDDEDKARPVLGGQEFPYPRRCRTGRSRSEKDPLSESRKGDFYVPRDEEFSEVKNKTFNAKTFTSVLQGVVPAIQALITDSNSGYTSFTAIDTLFREGVELTLAQQHDKGGISFGDILPRLVKTIAETSKKLLLFEPPELLERDRFAWIRNEEFSRQTLAGLNPCSIRLVTEWPLKSKLDPEEYGPQESAITTELIEQMIRGFMTVEEAIKQKKLFILDYHDIFLPYVKKVRQLKNTTLYGSRTLFFLAPDCTLMPLIIELTRPLMDGKPQWKDVYMPSWTATGAWLWKLARTHVLAHDSGYHQLVSHWLRTHCCVEPYIIAAHRQLSAVHPIFRLLHPHFRYTMEINALARQALINADGIIESAFTPGKYSMELSSVIYDLEWQFNLQALPADLINRGMAVEDPTAPHGLKLTIEDYPFANDGLILWDIIKQWVTDYVNRYYPEASIVESDEEIQAWWDEIRTKGHGDKKDSPGWPELKTPDDLIQILTTIIWVTSGHHAAVNFGQFDFAGYFPNRPSIARRTMPTEDPTDERWDLFEKKPELELLTCLPAQLQSTIVVAVLDVLSNHSPDEEYIGNQPEPSWAEDPVIKAAFERYNGRLMELEGIIDARNGDRNLKNRNGAGVVPYELLKPFSGAGVTGKGVPNSISI